MINIVVAKLCPLFNGRRFRIGQETEAMARLLEFKSLKKKENRGSGAAIGEGIDSGIVNYPSKFVSSPVIGQYRQSLYLESSKVVAIAKFRKFEDSIYQRNTLKSANLRV